MKLLIGWLLCGFIAAGFLFADFQGRFPSIAEKGFRQDMGFALIIGEVWGPFALLVSIPITGFGEFGWWIWFKPEKENAKFQ